VARAGQCVADRPALSRPPVPAEAAAPIRELAVEMLPLVGIGFTGEQAELGFFGEALVGLRWRQFAAVQLGLGGGSLNEERYVLLSAVPQFRPLPVALPVDVAIGAPIGYVNYVHWDMELVGNQGVNTTKSENGFHVGCLLSVMAEASETLAVGPAFQFDRIFADRGASFFYIALAGRYTHWIDSGDR
jgi:hypothetical protein